MCGIAAISVAAGDRFDTRKASIALLREIESRGPDATGAAWFNPDKDAHHMRVTKLNATASEFIAARRGELPRHAATVLLHTRYATLGSPKVWANNHPLVHGHTVGVHNGVLSNHDKLWAHLGETPSAVVDSAALVALVNATDTPVEQFRHMRGDAALAWVDMRAPETLHLARVTGRPLYVAQTTGGTVVAASTAWAVDAALDAVGEVSAFSWEVEEETYIKVTRGVIQACETIPDVHKDHVFTSRYAWTSGYSPKGNGSNVRAPKAPRKATPSKAVKRAADDVLFSEALATERALTYRAEWYAQRTDAELVRLAAHNDYAVSILRERGLDASGKLLAMEGADTCAR